MMGLLSFGPIRIRSCACMKSGLDGNEEEDLMKFATETTDTYGTREVR